MSATVLPFRQRHASPACVDVPDAKLVKKLIKYQIEISSDDMYETYVGLFQNSFDAYSNAIDRAGKVDCKVEVQVLP